MTTLPTSTEYEEERWQHTPLSRAISCLLRSFLHFCPPGPLTLFGKTSYSCAFLENLLVFIDANCRLPGWWSVGSSAPVLTRTSSSGRNKSAETMQKSMSNRSPKEPLHLVYLCTFLFWKKALVTNSAFLQHNCSGSLPLSFRPTLSSLPLIPYHTRASFPACAVNAAKTIVDCLVLLSAGHHYFIPWISDRVHLSLGRIKHREQSH